MDKLQQRTAAVSALLSRQAISSDVSSEYQEEAWADETVGRRARYTDLVFLGPELLSRAVLKGRALEGALFSSGKPVLLVPHGSKPRLKPNRVIVAWNSRLEASNAVSRTIEVLSAADAVHVVLVDPEGDEGTEPGADIAGYLARHGAQVTVERLPSQGRTVADTLRQHAIDISADLLVMGAYGHSRLRQRIFGGVTRSMIDKPPLPILMAH